MADEIRYYYSKDGIEAEGPVTRAELRELYRNREINLTSFLCPEGGAEWVHLRPAMFQSRLETPKPPPSPVYEEPKVKSRWYADEKLLDPKFKRLLMVLGALLTTGGALTDTYMRYGVFGATLMAPDSPFEIIFYFIVVAVLILVVPNILVRWVGYARRRLAAVVAIMLFIVFGIWGHAIYLKHYVNPDDQVQQDDVDQPVLPRPNVSRSYTQTDLLFYEKNLVSLKATSNRDVTDLATVRHDLVVVIDALVQKIHAWNVTAQAAHRFEPATITSMNDLNSLGDALVNYHQAQGDLYLYLKDIDSHCRESMSGDDFGENTVAEAIKGFRKAARIDRLIDLTNVGLKISDDQIICLKYLAAHAGHWKGVDGVLQFDDVAMVTEYSNLLQNFQTDVDTQQPLLTP